MCVFIGFFYIEVPIRKPLQTWTFRNKEKGLFSSQPATCIYFPSLKTVLESNKDEGFAKDCFLIKTNSQ